MRHRIESEPEAALDDRCVGSGIGREGGTYSRPTHTRFQQRSLGIRSLTRCQSHLALTMPCTAFRKSCLESSAFWPGRSPQGGPALFLRYADPRRRNPMTKIVRGSRSLPMFAALPRDGFRSFASPRQVGNGLREHYARPPYRPPAARFLGANLGAELWTTSRLPLAAVAAGLRPSPVDFASWER